VEVAKAEEIITAKLPQKAKKSTAKLPQKPEVETENDFFTDDDFAGDFDLFGKVSSTVWRVEKRLYDKQDGTTMLYYNYRRRKGRYVNGKRVNVYKKGGKRIWQSKR